jgi:hypothetical protein
MLRHIKISQSAKWLNPELGNSFCTVFPEVDNTDIQESKCARGALLWKELDFETVRNSQRFKRGEVLDPLDMDVR